MYRTDRQIAIDGNFRIGESYLSRALPRISKDLWDCPNNKDTGWIVEAGAEYFAQRLKSDVEGNPQSFGSRMLARGISEVERNGKELADPGIAEKGLVVFRYMIEKGWLAESRILDGSFTITVLGMKSLLIQMSF